MCGLCALVASLISFEGIRRQLVNYRKPYQQRLVVRIQLMIPLFAVSCYISLRSFRLSLIIEPVREIYEAFVIYTFFSLLTHLLGGERNIVILTSGRPPVSHPPPFNKLLPPVDISDPFSLLAIKRGILQYVWLKPIICLMFALVEITGLNDIAGINVYFVINLIYNISVSVSLYDLALFWKCMYSDLKPFNPWGKFLCVKLIIFASYWQGILLAVLNWVGVLPNNSTGDGYDDGNTLGFAIQNALLCVELIGFAIGHWHSFSWTEYRAEALPGCGRLPFITALKDVFGLGDLLYDFKSTFQGDEYDYRRFDSVEALIAHPTSKSRMARFNEGLRFTDSGRQKYWLPNASTAASGGRAANSKTPLLVKPRAGSIASANVSTRAIYANSMLTVGSKEDAQSVANASMYTSHSIEDNEADEHQDDPSLLEGYVYDDNFFARVKRDRPFGDKNYPVIYDTQEHQNSPQLQRLRREAMARQQRGLA